MAKAQFIQSVKVGSLELTQWQGSYKDQPTTYYTFKKQTFDKETKEYKESPFLGIGDVMSMLVAAQMTLNNYYGEKSKSSKNEPNEEAPF
jgi:hypothetical protein